jgi:hypothetical protein
MGNSGHKNMQKAGLFNKLNIHRYSRFALWGVAFLSAFHSPLAFASVINGKEIDDVAKNIVEGTDQIPGLISVFSYLIGLLFGVLGVLRVRGHVENPDRVPLKSGIIRLIIGGCFLAIPTVYEAMAHTINGGNQVEFDASKGPISNIMSNLMGLVSGWGITLNFNAILAKIVGGIADLPGFISALAYIMGLIFGVTGLIKLKDHVENPDQNPLQQGVIRLLAGGAMFALPTIYTAMNELIGGAGVVGNITSAISSKNMLYSSLGKGACDPTSGLLGGLSALFHLDTKNTLGGAMCNVVFGAGAFPAFLTAIAYLIGLVLGYMGIIKLKAHVQNPGQVNVTEGLSRLLAGGAMFALPVLAEVARNTVMPMTQDIVSNLGDLFGKGPVTGFNDPVSDSCAGLDGMLGCFASNVHSPIHIMLNFFTYCAGLILIMIGVSRLTKSAQDGAKGPGGFGTWMTFLTGGLLISYNELLQAMSGTLFGSPRIKTMAKLKYADGIMGNEVAHAQAVIGSVVEFMIMIGIISFVRGIFIIRGVAEGNNQSSIMAGMTHVVGGALAVNIGPLINAVQATLGMTDYGIAFS